MATNVRGSNTREAIDGEEIIRDDMVRTDTVVAEPRSTVGSARRSGVAVYDSDPARLADPTLRPTPSHTTDVIESEHVDDRMLVEPRSTGSIVGWFIGAVLLIVIAYFLLQILF